MIRPVIVWANGSVAVTAGTSWLTVTSGNNVLARLRGSDELGRLGRALQRSLADRSSPGDRTSVSGCHGTLVFGRYTGNDRDEYYIGSPTCCVAISTTIADDLAAWLIRRPWAPGDAAVVARCGRIALVATGGKAEGYPLTEGDARSLQGLFLAAAATREIPGPDAPLLQLQLDSIRVDLSAARHVEHCFTVARGRDIVASLGLTRSGMGHLACDIERILRGAP